MSTQKRTPEQLGAEVFNLFQSGEPSDWKSFIPDVETYMASFGYHFHDERIREYEVLYHMTLQNYPERYQMIKDQWKLDWEKMIVTKIVGRTILLPHEDLGEMTNIEISFSYQEKSYQMVLPNIFDLDGHWYLALGLSPIYLEETIIG